MTTTTRLYEDVEIPADDVARMADLIRAAMLVRYPVSDEKLHSERVQHFDQLTSQWPTLGEAADDATRSRWAHHLCVAFYHAYSMVEQADDIDGFGGRECRGVLVAITLAVTPHADLAHTLEEVVSFAQFGLRR